MKVKFADNTVIETTGNITMFLFRNAPQYLDEWLNHQERFNYEFSKIERWLKSGKEVQNGN